MSLCLKACSCTRCTTVVPTRLWAPPWQVDMLHFSSAQVNHLQHTQCSVAVLPLHPGVMTFTVTAPAAMKDK